MDLLFREYDVAELGKDGYPRAWHESIKHIVRDEAGHRCVRCGHPYRADTAFVRARGEWSMCDHRCTHGGDIKVEPNVVSGRPETWAKWRILTVHHLDGNKANCRWWNLAALCQRCHLQVQGKVRMQQTYPFEHSDWFKPYVAGYYALSYLDEELTRDQALERMDELLALERISFTEEVRP